MNRLNIVIMAILICGVGASVAKNYLDDREDQQQKIIQEKLERNNELLIDDSIMLDEEADDELLDEDESKVPEVENKDDYIDQTPSVPVQPDSNVVDDDDDEVLEDKFDDEPDVDEEEQVPYVQPKPQPEVQLEPEATVPAPETKPDPEITPDPEVVTPTDDQFLATVEQRIYELVNVEREKAGLFNLGYNTTMQKYARIKSKDMGVNGYFDHQDLRGDLITSQMTSDGVTYQAWGENIAYIGGGSVDDAANQFMTNWMNSDGHRANILSNDYDSIGVGVYKIGNKMYATQEFYR